jgi:hypothetical protein
MALFGKKKIFNSNSSYEREIWAYQDFAPGQINSTTVILTANQNGSGTFFFPGKIVSGIGRAAIFRSDDLEAYVYTWIETIPLFSSKIYVVTINEDEVTLNAIPHSSYSIRIWYKINSSSIPFNYTMPPMVVSSSMMEKLDQILVTQDEIIDNLLSTDTDKVLSANQGKVLKDLIDALTPGDIPGFNEAVDDEVNSLIQDGVGITWVYDDINATLTPTIDLSPGFDLVNNLNNRFGLGINDSDSIVDPNTGYLWMREANDLIIGTNDIERLRIHGSGEIVTNGLISANSLEAINIDGSIFTGGIYSGIKMTLANSSGDIFTINASSGAYGIKIFGLDTSTSPVIFYINDSNKAFQCGINSSNHGTNPSDAYLWHLDNQGIRIGTNNTEQIYIAGNGAIKINSLTASRAIVTDSSKNLISLVYTSANTNSALVSRDASGNFSANTITASLSGNATTATTANNVATANESADTSCFINFVTSSGTQSSIPIKTNTGLTYNSSTNNIGATTFTGNSVKLSNSIIDNNNNELIIFGTTTSAVNEIKITNAATSNGPLISANGSDVNIDLLLQAKGSNNITFLDGTDNTKKLKFNLSSIGTTKTTTLTFNNPLDATLTFPSASTIVVGNDTNDFLSNKTLIAPKIQNNDYIADFNGNKQLIFTQTTSAVNQLRITNAATGNGPSIKASGDDANINLVLIGKGNGAVQIADSTDNTKLVEFNSSNNGSGIKTTFLTFSSGASRNISFRNASYTVGGFDPTQGGTGLTSYIKGDMMYASADNILSTVAGNTVATKKFLTSVGTGTFATAPGWNSIQTDDLPVGIILQTVSVTKVNTFSAAGTLASGGVAVTGLSASITLKKNTNKVLILVTMTVANSNVANNSSVAWIARGSTKIGAGTNASSRIGVGGRGYYADQDVAYQNVMSYIDTAPGTTTPTYNVYVAANNNNIVVNRSYDDSDTNGSSGSRSSSTITLFEIKT